MKLSQIFLLLFLMAGCAGPAAQVAKDAPIERQERPIASLAAFAADDLRNAITIAQGAGDKAGEACYTAILAHIGKPVERPLVTGAFSAFEAGRVGVNRIQAGISPEVHAACAVVILDAQSVLTRLIGIASGRVALPIPLP